VLPRLGCVAIGRNEGERLRRCLTSLSGRAANIVYVDSASTDGSVEMARAHGVDTVELDMSIPFTAARARNAGFERLLAKDPNVELVQFVDGDCEVVEGWLELAHRTLEARRELAVVFGRRRERHTGASIYNRICDVEWDTPIGEAKACGGDAMMRVEALKAAGGYNDALIAGEEPELCVRIRRAGWKIERLDAEMTLHDAAMTRFSQWWKRNVRSGYAYAEGSALHGSSPERHWVKESRRIVLWGAVVPAVATLGVLPSLGTSLLLLGGYPVTAVRAYRDTRRRGRSIEDSAAYAVSCTLGRLPELQGLVKYHWGALTGRRSKIIEYKGASPGQ
jgi:GT2 family glycosyltransferase